WVTGPVGHAAQPPQQGSGVRSVRAIPRPIFGTSTWSILPVCRITQSQPSGFCGRAYSEPAGLPASASPGPYVARASVAAVRKGRQEPLRKSLLHSPATTPAGRGGASTLRREPENAAGSTLGVRALPPAAAWRFQIMSKVHRRIQRNKPKLLQRRAAAVRSAMRQQHTASI